jgi:hypothetical protein
MRAGLREESPPPKEMLQMQSDEAKNMINNEELATEILQEMKNDYPTPEEFSEEVPDEQAEWDRIFFWLEDGNNDGETDPRSCLMMYELY